MLYIARTQLELYTEIVDNAVVQGVGFKWVGFDGFYDRSKSFLANLDDKDLTFVGDVPVNLQVALPGSENLKWVRDLAEKRRSTRVALRPQAKGFLQVDAMSVAVEVTVAKGDVRKWRLIVTRDIGTGDTKYSLTNSNASLRRVAYMQRQRYWVERTIQDAKTSCVMAQYQLRGWGPWDHHMASSDASHAFLTPGATVVQRNPASAELPGYSECVGPRADPISTNK